MEHLYFEFSLLVDTGIVSSMVLGLGSLPCLAFTFVESLSFMGGVLKCFVFLWVDVLVAGIVRDAVIWWE